MAQANQIPQARGIDHFTWWFDLYFADAVSLFGPYGLEVGARTTSSEHRTLSLMDALYLWLQDTDPGHESICFRACPTYESYLLSVIFILDAWSREGGKLSSDHWERAQERYGLTTAFPSLAVEENVDPYYTNRIDELIGGQHDHPALRKDVFEHYQAVARTALVDHHARSAVKHAVKKTDAAIADIANKRKQQ